MTDVSPEVVRMVLSEVYPQYQDDVFPENADKILESLTLGKSQEEATNFLKAGGRKMDYSALIADFTSIASLIISVITLYRDVRKNCKAEADAKTESDLIVELADERVRSDPRLLEVVNAVRRAVL